jgi:hypothetical protein
VLGVATNETFTLTDLDGGALLDGDEVRIAASERQHLRPRTAAAAPSIDIRAGDPSATTRSS